jgi:hypothetical protein
VIDENLNKGKLKGKLAKILIFFKKKGVEDRDEIKQSQKIIKAIGQGDEKVLLLRNLK